MKQAYYFPHYIGARNDRKIKRVRKDLGTEGYALYFMTLEILREEENLKFPLNDIDILSDDFGTSDAKLKVLILNYDLFEIENTKNGEIFFSPKQIQYLEPYFRQREQRKLAGIASGKSRRKKAEQLNGRLTDVEQLTNKLSKKVKNNYKNTKEIIDSLIDTFYQNQKISAIAINNSKYIISFSTTDKKLELNLQQLRELPNRIKKDENK